MKQFIVLAAILPLLLAMLFQFMLNEVHQSQSIAATRMVHNATMKATLSGGLTYTEMMTMKYDLAHIFGVKEYDVILTTSRRTIPMETIFDPPAPPDLITTETGIDDANVILVEPPKMVTFAYTYHAEVPVSRIMAANLMMGVSDAKNRGKWSCDFEVVSYR
ncbi:MAG: hypothetical protein LBN22_03240 [Clostridiales Family XIII bacterium]|jgi:hypothetical protein|nr:hypothetical protein [Clostridiales Family XIII bacterium]